MGREHKAVENGGRGKLMARQGSSSPLAAVVHVAGRNDRPPHPIREKTSQIQSSLETCLVETIRTAAPVATARATTRVQATTTTKGSIMAARIRLVDANVTITRRSLTRMAGHTEGAEDESGRTWCYTTGWGNSGCGDLQSSRRFPNNPWS